jgi:hypothetical protein
MTPEAPRLRLEVGPDLRIYGGSGGARTATLRQDFLIGFSAGALRIATRDGCLAQGSASLSGGELPGCPSQSVTFR